MLRTKKKWVTDYKMALSLLEDTEVLFEFFKEGEGTQKQVEERFTQAHELTESLEFRNMLGQDGDAHERCTANYGRRWWYGELRLGQHVNAHVFDVGREKWI